MKALKKNQGITLIALVITIIVMLILVAVTITMAINGGLFDYAGNAAKQTEEAKQKELDWANIATGQDYDQLIDKYTTDGTTTYGLSADGKTFIGQLTENINRHQNGNAECANGYKFTEGHFIYKENYTIQLGQPGVNVFLCWDEDGVNPEQRTETTGSCDVYTTDGEFIRSQTFQGGESRT